MEPKPPFISNIRDLPQQRSSYPGHTELLSAGIPLGRLLGLVRLGIHHETLPPGSRTSWPHAEEKEEEFVLVLEGMPDLWLNGVLYRLEPGDACAFIPGTGLAHTLINNTEQPVRLLVIGEHLDDNRIHYVFEPEGYLGMKPEKLWRDAAVPLLGNHDGLPDALRNKM
ncbi:cupin domain-containing protein [Anthocerotibacter panamensis]|uniref:cupin domain-containing protein n=1 Tax=Anthocerotibacter panamensis TaxID=2857077 RepID=UPI001C40838F|nr:cupin domain-containing protein [Anthocerotibacter panamensis]